MRYSIRRSVAQALGAAILAKTVRYRVAAAWILGIVIPVSVIAIPLKVTVDGIMYISSAKALFKSIAATNYVWYREPGYPLLLKALHYLGDDGLYIVLVQSAFLGIASFIALYAVTRALGQTRVSVMQLVIVVFLVLNPMFLIYGALVLQQALFTLQLSFFVLGVLWAVRRPTRLPLWLLLVLVLLNYLVAIWTSIGWIYLGLVPTAASIVLSLWPIVTEASRRAVSRVRRRTIRGLSVVVTMLVIVIVYVGGLQAYAGWDMVKAHYAAPTGNQASVIQPLSSVPYIPTPAQMATRMLAIMHLGKVEPYTYENDLFLRQQMLLDWPYSQWDTKYVDKPYTTYAVGYFSLPNPSGLVHNAYIKSSGGASFFYSTTFVAFLLAIALALIAPRRRWLLLLVLLVPLSFIAVYAASNSPIDRYGIPVYPWAAAGFMFLLSWIGDLGRRLYLRWRPVARTVS